jgi:RHS repeat-associated protein
MTYPDTIREVGGEYVRQLPDSVWVIFDAQGRHVRTRNRQGHLTTFAYDGNGRLQSLSVPPAASPLTYQFAYGGNGRLQSVTAPGQSTPRVTTMTVEPGTGRITAIQDPGTPLRVVQFDYRGDGLLTSRINGRGVATTMQYDTARRIRTTTLDMAGTTPNIVRTVRNWQSVGWGGTTALAQRLRTVLTGPRGDTTSFVLNRYGAPDSIVDALAQVTSLLRSNSTLPGLVTDLTTPTGMTVTAGYDTRGRLLTRTQPATTNVPAITSYQWDPLWDQVTRITNPEGDFTLFGIAPATGNRVSQEDARGPVSQIVFTYNAANQLESVTRPSQNPESYAYDVLGNLSRVSNQLDHTWSYTNNAIGLTTSTNIPTGTQVQGRPFEGLSQTWSERNEELSNVRLSADGSSRSRPSITLESSYDAEGNRTSAGRSWSTGSGPIMLPLLTSVLYDRADRPTRQTEPDGSFATMAYDLAGNLTSTVTRRGNTVSMDYDLLNRLTTRSIPVAAAYSYPVPNIVPAIAFDNDPYGFTRSAETQSYTYHPSGQIATATGLDGDVSRTFHPNGALLTETQGVRTRDRTSMPHLFTLVYQYDRNGRRTALTLGPGSVFPGNALGYQYTSWGALQGVTDIAGNAYGVGYNARSEVTSVTYPGGVTQTLGYDQAGRLNSDQITRSGPTGFPFPTTSLLRDFTVPSTGRNARGQILFGTDPTLVGSAIPVSTFDGFGRLTVDSLVASGFVITLGPAVFRSREQISYNPNGDILKRSGTYALPPNVVSYNTTNNYDANFRLQMQSSTSGTKTWYRYDGAGSTRMERTTSASDTSDNDNANTSAERAAYYSADDRLIASDARRSGRRTLEEYRYDALGRRTWVSTRTQCGGNPQIADCLTSSVRRVIWDGAQELAEIQAPYDAFANAPVGSEELDAAMPLLPRSTCSGANPCDPNPFYGQVVYAPGLALDQPLGVTRFRYKDNTGSSSLQWPTFTQSIFWNVRGTPAYGLFETGAESRPFTPAAGQTACSLTSSGTDRCVLTQWPFAQNAYDRARGKLVWASWSGSLLRNKVDGTGLEYLRNRVYDSQSGRFTQEDPIGLAGGLNLYGFAGGDPANFSDPFGLFACPPNCEGVFERLGQMAPAMERAISAATAVNLAPALLLASGIEGIATLGLTPQSAAAGAGLGIIPSAIGKVNDVAGRVGVSGGNLLRNILSTGEKFIDKRNNNNINILMNRPDGGSGMVRATLDPSGGRVISAGMMRTKQVKDLVESGQMVRK